MPQGRTSWQSVLSFISVAALAVIIGRIKLRSSQPQDLFLAPSTYALSLNDSLDRVVVTPFKPRRTADTTAVILNWSRFPNVVRIVALLCSPLLEDTIATVFIWNNNPLQLLFERVCFIPPSRIDRRASF